MLDTTALHEYFQELEARDEFSGVAWISRGEEQLFGEAYGFASRAWGIRNALETRFDTASVTKLFTAVATLQLVEGGSLSLDTRVVDFLGLKDTSISPDATVYHLLTHTSGIGDDVEEEDGESYEEFWKTRPSYMVRETADFLPQFVHKPANFPPGGGCRYCNCSFILLGLCIEQISGMGYRDYVRREVFARAGMTDSDFLHLDRVNERVAEGMDPIRDEVGALVGWKRNIYSFPPVGSPDSGACVTASDLDRFLRAVKGGKLLSPELAELFFTPQVHYQDREGWEQKYGIVLWFYVAADGKVVCCEKEGINAGASALIRHFPEQDVNVVLLSNMEAGVWEPIRKIHALLVGEA